MVHCMFNAGHWITLGVDVWSMGHFVTVVLGHYYFLDLYTGSGHGFHSHHVRCHFSWALYYGQDHGEGLYPLLVCSEGFFYAGSSRVIPRFQPWLGHSRIVGIILFAMFIQKIDLHVSCLS